MLKRMQNRLMGSSLLIFCVICLVSPVLAANKSEIINCLEADPQNAGLTDCRQLFSTDSQAVVISLDMVDELAESFQYGQAINLAEAAIRFLPDEKRFTHKLKELKSYEKERQWSERRKSAAARTEPATPVNSTDYKLNRIRCLRLTGEAALRACNLAIIANKQDHQLYRARGKLLETLGRSSEASRDFKLWVQYNPANTTVQQAKSSTQSEDSAERSPETAPDIIKIDNSDPMKIVIQQSEPEVIEQSALPPEQNVAIPDSPAGPEQTSQEVAKQEDKSPPSATSTGDGDVLTQKLITLKSLRDRALISQEEYKQRKEALLDTVIEVEASPTSQPKKKESYNLALFGEYHALVIGEQNYQFLPKLKAAAHDARAVATLLKDQYGFSVTTLIDASRRDILTAISQLRNQLEPKDNLLIYYAGHGWLDEQADSGYWLPVEAVEQNQVDWISMATITASVRALQAKHVMIVADSCFSGKLARGLHIPDRSRGYFNRIAQKKARVAMTSGGLEPVLDGGGTDGHSVFASIFLQVLRENEEILDGSTLFSKLRRPVMLRAEQVPEYSDIRLAGHEGGDFIFLPTRLKQ
ncbi:MAG: hypothetical protein D6B25_16770 [Desulfobulbaceae bacterium]|nr:MAG: hypothetical protein D6B25_16770 [Desulfobulbaceae bacterium]